MKPVELNFDKDTAIKFVRFATKKKIMYQVGFQVGSLYPIKVYVKNSKEAFDIGAAWAYFFHVKEFTINQWEEFYAKEQCKELGLIARPEI